MRKKLLVEGMSCEHCVRHVEEALKELDGVTSAKANLKEKSAIVELNKDIPADTFKAAIEDAGYELKGVEEI